MYWGSTHSFSFNALEDIILHGELLTFHRPDHTIYVDTDASGFLWETLVTQIAPCELENPRVQQQNEQLAFIGGAFKDAELGWTTFEKESFVMYGVFEKLNYLFFASNSTRVYTDHRKVPFLLLRKPKNQL